MLAQYDRRFIMHAVLPVLKSPSNLRMGRSDERGAAMVTVSRNETPQAARQKTRQAPPTLMKNENLTKEGFDRLMEWLGKDREAGALKYEAIRRDLIRYFGRSVGADAEELADETINRIIEKLPQISGSYTGDPKYLFFRYAQLARLEQTRKLARRKLPREDDYRTTGDLPDPRTFAKAKAEAEAGEQANFCLIECLRKLRPEERRIFLLYYQEGNRLQLDWRRSLAAEAGISLNALRLQIHRQKERLYACIVECRRRT
jgi:DNA-directed RNA polymerase specialized sigma24 family protein